MVKKRAIILAEIIFLIVLVSYFSAALSITVNSPLNQTYNDGNISLNIDVDKQNSTCRYTFQSISNQSMSNNTETTFYKNIEVKTEATYYLIFHCRNNDSLYESAIQQIEFVLDFCIPAWQQVNSSCFATDELLAHYIDSNDCYAKTNDPTDLAGRPQNTTLACDYCTPDWQKFNGNCKTNNEWDVWFNDSNSCFQKTGLSSDNNKPANTTETCDYCTPNWQPRNTSCESNGRLIQYSVDSNNCYSQTNNTSDNNPPSNTSIVCDSCVPEWELANTSCENNEITQYAYDLNDCYKKTGLEEDKRGEGWESNSTFLKYCNSTGSPNGTGITGSVVSSTATNNSNSSNDSNVSLKLLTENKQENKESKLTGAITGTFEDILKNKGDLAGIVILFILIIALISLFIGFKKKVKGPTAFGFN